MRFFPLFLITLLFSYYCKGLDTTDRTVKVRQIYENAYGIIENYIESNNREGFKRAVFATENAYFENSLQYDAFQIKVDQLASLVKAWVSSNGSLPYRFDDSINFRNNYGIYTLMKDTIKFALGDSGSVFSTIPYIYDFDDFSGRINWTKMFVTKALYTQSGNCHSLPYLYKILADEVGAICWLALAPNHIYIKNRCKKIGWYNTELTSGNFPIDAWIATSGYIPIQAIRSGIYMDTLSNRQSIALCLLDLAKGYEAKVKNYSDSFIIKCCNKVIQIHPVNVQAMLLKAEVLKRQYLENKPFTYSSKEAIFKEMQSLYLKLYDLGYREMPDRMYLQWLSPLATEKEKYRNRAVMQ